MDHYTIIITKEQKDIIAKAVETFSQMHLGQTSVQREEAKALDKQMRRIRPGSVSTTINNLTS